MEVKLNLKQIAQKAKEIGLARNLWDGFAEDWTHPLANNTTLRANIEHLFTEVAELSKSVRSGDKQNAKEEVVDILMVTLGIAEMMQLNVSDQDFADVFLKNQHRINALKTSK